MKRMLRYAAILAVIAVGGWFVFAMLHLFSGAQQFRSNDDQLRTENAKQDDEIVDLLATVDLLNQQLEALGQTPIVEPPDTESDLVVDGAPSLDITQTLVRLAVESACGGASCLGPVGPTGLPGAPGVDGVNGRDGSTPTDERLLGLIQPLIPAPIPGTPGVNGADGRGVSGVQCSALIAFDLTFSFTDGTTQTVSCGPVQEPPVDPPTEVLP